MMTQTPATIMNIDSRKGTLERGKDADIVIFNDNIDVRMTIVGGEIVHRTF
jgi:N-acetylglucosamine-6-phosphate deacetylase